MLRKLIIPLVAVAGIATATGIAYASDGGAHGPLAQLKRATTKYHDLSVADSNQYGLFPDKDGITCIDMPGMGAMGVHYANGGIVPDGAIDPLRPEALVYAPDKHGNLHLAAVEFVVFKADWDANHSSPPNFFGQEFNFTPEGNRFGLPPYYSLHVWLFKRNPAGMFAMWNPNVSCTPGHQHEHEHEHDDMGGNDD
jgi:hypothetical protein